MSPHQQLQRSIISCTQCPRLVEWREQVAQEKTARYAERNYWGKPVPSFGNVNARLLIVGLAPAAHGANRTGRMFTGDRSGEWLYRTLHSFGFASQAESTSVDDGLTLNDCYITATLHCAPPLNKPLPEETKNCRQFLLNELELLDNIQVIVALGKIAFDAVFDSFTTLQRTTLPKRPAFKHNADIQLHERITLIASYHPSQQNTFTGKLTQAMFDRVFEKAKTLISTTNKKH